MKITIFAATGGIGRQLLQQATAAGTRDGRGAHSEGLVTDARVVTADSENPT